MSLKCRSGQTCQRQNSEHLRKLPVLNIRSKGNSKEILRFLPIRIIRDLTVFLFLQESTDTTEEKQLSYLPEELEESCVENLEPVQKYKESVENLLNSGENYETISDYKKSVMELLNIKITGKSS